MEEEVRKKIFAAALENAVKHGNVPKPGAVVGLVLGKYPELRARAQEVTGVVREVVAEVASLPDEERILQLKDLCPDFFIEETGKKTQERSLPPLQGGDAGVVMRFAPNPSGPLHLGHARAAVLNDEYVRRYGGKYILRVEDTDPKRVDPLAYRMVIEDCEWLGLSLHEIVYQSDRLLIYQKYIEQLLAMGGAYVCTCENDRFRVLRQEGVACPCRGGDVEDQLERFEQMKNGVFREGGASVRLKTDLTHPDPAMRDFPLFRILTSTAHPRVDASLYPLMNFSVTIDDHLLGMTHVIRGKDHIANTRRQQYIFDYFGWTPPRYLHYGRMGIEGVILSTSQMRQGICDGVYCGWDDIRLGTLRALGKRGISPLAVRRSMIDIGIGETDISFSWDNLFAQNRNIVDHQADRFFFTGQPVPVMITGAEKQEATAMRYPGDAQRGFRTLHFEKEVYLSSHDIPVTGGLIRLKDLFNVRISSGETGFSASFAGDSLADIRSKKASIIQWLPVSEAVPCLLRTPEGDINGFCEPGVRDQNGQVVQFERVGFARIDHVGKDGVVAYFTHR